MSDRWRCFVAIPIGERLRTDLARAVSGWRGDPDLSELRWTDPDAWHVTLAFIGWTDPGDADAIISGIRAVAESATPTSVATGGVGAFPSPGRARVLWYGIEDSAGTLANLARALHRALELDLPDSFRAHLTLARARRDPVRLRDSIGSLVAPPGTLAVEEMRLMRSHPGGGPARYETLEAVRLGTSVNV